jgi:hypothetical protein
MKKVIVTLVAVGLVAGGFFQPVFAQDKKVEFGLNLGFMTDSFEEFLIALSPQVDIHVTKGFMISPEVMIATEFPIYGALLFPGVIFNYTGRGFFAGAGAVVPILISAEWSGSGDLLPKLNIGYRGQHVSLTAYLITSTRNLFRYNLVGATIGYRF